MLKFRDSMHSQHIWQSPVLMIWQQEVSVKGNQDTCSAWRMDTCQLIYHLTILANIWSILQQEATGGGNQGMVQTAWQTPPPAQLGGRTQSPATSESSARNQRLGRLRGGVAGNIAENLKSSHSSNGGFSHTQQPSGLPPK